MSLATSLFASAWFRVLDLWSAGVANPESRMSRSDRPPRRRISTPMHLLRRRLSWIMILLPVVISGCSTTLGSRLGGKPQTQAEQPKTIAVVGDRPVSVASGEPGDRVVVEADPEPKPSPKARISGRVVDAKGEPVANVIVRLADGGTKGGKDVRGKTDRSGAFTLNGLRPGSTYSLIAETEDEEQRPLTGRVTARTAATGVEIALLSDDAAEKATARKTGRAAKARPISQVEESEEGSTANRDDVATPTEATDEIDPGPPTDSGRPRLSTPQALNGWQNSRTASVKKAQSPTEDADAVATSAEEIPRRSKVVKADPSAAEVDEEESNPLPPAHEPGQEPETVTRKPTSARLKPKTGKAKPKPSPNRLDSGEMMLAPDTSSVEKPGPARSLETGNPETILASAELPAVAEPTSGGVDPSGALPEPGAGLKTEASTAQAPPPASGPLALPDSGAGAAAPAVIAAAPPGPPPVPSTAIQALPTNPPATQPVFASQDLATPPKPASPGPQADYNPFALVGATVPEVRQSVDLRIEPPSPKPVASTSLAIDPAPVEHVPVASAPTTSRTKWGDIAPLDSKPKVKVEPTKVTLASALVRRFRPTTTEPVEKVDNAIASCSYDARLRKLKDFRLPDLDGKPVRFQDLDADYVLLDFWGTWCGPCFDSIPHLVDLQKKYGPARLKVVGIACEEVPPDQRKKKVEEVSRRLGINYAVLLSTMDGKPCPVQQAFAIQAMPTMILLDRKGTVIWRSTGATPANESRLDRVLASQMSWSDTVRR